MKFAVFHPGVQHSWQTATALQQLGLLEFYATSIFYRPDRWPYRVARYLPERLRGRVEQEFRRFEHAALDPANVRTAGVFEWAERIAARAGMDRLALRLDIAGNRRFARLSMREIESARPFGLWAYNSSALETLRAGRRTGRVTVLDRTIGDWRYYNAAMAPVYESHAEWFTNGPPVINQAAIDREEAEYEAADHIVCGSAFCAQTIRDYSGAAALGRKLRVLPYCFDEALFGDLPPPRAVDRGGPVRFLFVGQIGMRKGIHHVLEAIARLPRSQAELTLVGQLQIDRAVFARYADRVTYIPTVPRGAMPGIMARHHAMVFPSYFEGSSLSLLEGLASGMALIHPPQAGNGVTPDSGLLIERPDTELTFAAMLALIEDRDMLDRFRAHAQAEARNYTFARYREAIGRFVGSIG